MDAGEDGEDFPQRIAHQQHGGEHRHREQQRDEHLTDEIFMERFQRMNGRAQSDGFATRAPVKTISPLMPQTTR